MHTIIEGQRIADCEMWSAMATAKVSGDRAEVVRLARVVLHGFSAAVDYPASLFYSEIMEAFPECVVVLTTRERALEPVVSLQWSPPVRPRPHHLMRHGLTCRQ